MNLFIYFNQKDRYNKTKTNRMSENNTIEFVLNTNGSISDSNDNWLLYQGSSGSVNPNNFKNLILGDVCLTDSFEDRFDDMFIIDPPFIDPYFSIICMCYFLFLKIDKKENFISYCISIPILIFPIYFWNIKFVRFFYNIMNYSFIYEYFNANGVISFIKNIAILTFHIFCILFIYICLKTVI